MTKTYCLFLLFLLLLTGVARAQPLPAAGSSSGIVPVGNYLSHTLENGTLRIQSENGELEVLPFDHEIIRVTFIPGGINFKDTSYLVVIEPQLLTVELEIQADHLTMTTEKLEIRIEKNPVTISVFRGSDLLASEDLGNYTLEGGQGVRFGLDPEEMLYGSGSRALPLNHRGFLFENYNQPHYGYSNWEPNLNISIPLVLSSKGYLLFFDNAYPGYFDLGSTNAAVLDYYSESGPLSYFLIAGDAMDRIMDRYTLLTGRQPLPPLWSLGYIQSRFGYETQSQAQTVVNQMRQHGFPMDALVLDLYWYGGVSEMCNMTWDPARFPDPEDMMNDFKDQGIKTILISDPYFTLESNPYAYLSGTGLLCRNSQGATYVMNNFWAGPAGLLDMTHPAAFPWFWIYYKARIQEGVEGWWCDLGEPELHPDDMVHFDGTAREIHNLYSFLWAQQLYEKYAANYPDRRLFNLIRSGYSGMQRYSTFPWSGDVSRSWEGLQSQIPIMLGMGLSGVAYMGSDLGGFTGEQNNELYVRWMQFGCFSPVMRAHGTGAPTEPVYYPEEHRDIVRNYIRLRYQMLPYNYSLAWLNSLTGRPLALPMNYFDPSDPVLGNISDQYFWGENLLVAPVTGTGQEFREVYLPEGRWIDFLTGDVYDGKATVSVAAPLDRIPVFVKAGSFIPMATPMLSTDFYHNDTLLVWYYPDKSCPYSSFDVYSDNGETKDAFQKGEYELITFSGDTHDDNITVTITKEGNEYTGAPGSRELVFDVKRIKKRPETVLADGTPVIMAADSEEFHSLPAAWYWDEPANILRVHFRWESESSLLAIAGADLGIEPLQESYPAFILYPPFPNPFSDQFRVKFRINLPGEYAIRIQNAPGQVISQKTIHIDLPGMYDFKWDGKDDKGTNMGNGIYILTLGSSSGQLEMVKVIRMGDRND